MVNQYLITFSIFSQIFCSFIQYMNEDEQFQQDVISLSLNQFEDENSYFAYGLWSRYNPLSSILPIGRIGIFDSNCYNLHNTLESTTEQSNFLYYDCVNYESKTIKKIIQFIDDKGNQHIFFQDIDYQNYENVWFYFTISIWPIRHIFQLMVIQYPNIILIQNLDIIFPYYDSTLQFTFGGDLQLQQSSRISSFNQNLVFSYFPGKMYLYPISYGKGAFDINTADANAINIFNIFAKCQCQFDMNARISDEILKFLSMKSILTSTPNCDSFSLTGWIKAIDIHQSDSEFLFKFIKLSINTEKNQLTIDDLSPFQLLYRFANNKQFLQILTYSYTFPSVNIDFSQNPFLIQHEFELIKNITLWHFLSVTLRIDQLQISIIFYDGEDQLKLDFNIHVNHFHYIKLQGSFGNILGDARNYLNMRIVQLNIFPCLMWILYSGCHQSCLTCDGPTQNDCLTCSIELHRFYDSSSKSCKCLYFNFDQQNQCLTFDDLNFSLVSLKRKPNTQCLYGYFQYDDQYCFKCPSDPNINTIQCLDCLQNPQTWKLYSSCLTSINYNLSDNLAYAKTIDRKRTYFIQDNENIRFCWNCQQESLYNIESIYLDFMQVQNYEDYFCLKNYENSNSLCHKCNIPNCLSCIATIQGLQCIQCELHQKFQNGECVSYFFLGTEVCIAPYYITSTYECKLCIIENCQYCFEYLKNDFSKSTLYKNFLSFEVHEFHSIGCALCQDGYQFNAQEGKCLYQEPQIQNCLRSFIDLNGIEVCTLSDLDTFELSPQIDNCQNFILNCQQCVRTPSYIIRCIICMDGYTTNISTGQCDICKIQYSKKCIQGDAKFQDGWVQLVQSFIMQFLNNKYFYPKPSKQNDIVDFVISCQDGYKPSSINKCKKYCPSECLNCVQQTEKPFEFQCLQCSLNQYYKVSRSTDSISCLSCPLLCSICQARTNEQLKQLNPYFLVTQENIQYSYQCIQKAFRDKVIIDPKFQIARYIFDDEESILNSDVVLYCDYLQQIGQPISSFYFENQMNLEYCNQMGIDIIQITFQFLHQPYMECRYNHPTIFYTSLKAQIFSLSSIIFELTGYYQYQSNNYSDSLVTQNFDQVQISQINFELINNRFFEFQNDYPIQFTLKNAVFYSDFKKSTTFSISNNFFKSITLVNLTFYNLNIINSTFFNISGEYLEQEIQIINILIDNCIFRNSTFMYIFQNSLNINIENFTIKSSNFQNSNIFSINSNKTVLADVNLKTIKVIENYFYDQSNCIFISNFQQLLLQQVIFNFNSFSFSNFITFNSNSILSYFYVNSNKFDNSTIFLSNGDLFGIQIAYQINHFFFKDNELNDSISFQIIPKYTKAQQLIIQLDQCQFENNLGQNSLTTNIFLFQIQCDILKLAFIDIIEQYQISFMYIYETNFIQITNLTYANTKKQQKIPLGLMCSNNGVLLQAIKIFGFEVIKLENISIFGLFTFDSSILEFSSNILFNSEQLELIQMKNVIFSENVMVKYSLGKSLSLIQIYSEKTQKITFNKMNFQKNLFHQTVDDPSDTSAGLIYTHSQLSNILIDNIASDNNGITNSSCSTLFFIAISLSIQNYYVNNLNIFTKNQLRNYFENIDIFNVQSQEQIQLLVQKELSIQTKGGVCSATFSQFHIINGTFQNIFCQTSAIFELITQGLGLIIMKNLLIQQVDIIYDANLNMQGCITVYSQNSLLNLDLYDVQFINIFSKFSPAIFQITPSLRKNKIILKNIQIINSLSLQNSILKAEFLEQKQNSNQVQLQNISISQTEKGWKNYFQKIGQISTNDLEKIMNDNALFNLMSCSLIIKNFFITGVLISPILKIIDSQDLIILSSQFHTISVVYSLNLIQVSQNKYNIMKILLLQNEFRRIQLYQPSETDYYLEQIQLNSVQFESNCLLKMISFNNFQFSFSQIMNLIQTQQIQEGSILSLKSLYNLTNMQIQSIKLMENNCSFCNLGLLSIEIQQIYNLKLKEIICIRNKIKQYGCVNIKNSNNQFKNRFSLSNSVLALNIGSQGTGVNFRGLKGVLNSCKIFNNSATNTGGGMYIDTQNNDFLINNSQILQNKAEEAGGINLNGNSNLNSQNFLISYLKFNKANALTNNLIETPTNLALVINNFEMFSTQQLLNNITHNNLQIHSYKVLQQNKLLETNFLMIPSNQIITEYQIYYQNIQKFKSYIQEISLFFKNSLFEKLGNYDYENCTVYQNIISVNGSQVSQQEVFILVFDQQLKKIDLGYLNFTFSPYSQQDLVQQIQVFCQVSEQKVLSYNINTKTFLCQLGEFYSKSGCQICEASFGFYSITYNATKCSIFDKTRFSNITSNTISLLPGFWRPEMLSDDAQQCFKEVSFCLGGWQINDNSCFYGHIGGLCEECDIYNIRGQGYFFKNTQNIECLLCNDSKSYIVLFVFVFLLAILSILITLRSINKTNSLFTSLKLKEKFGKIIFKLNQDHQSFLIKMFLSYLWIFSIIFTYNISFSINLNIIDQASNTSFFMANNLDCYISEIYFANLTYIRIIVTVLFVFFQLLLIYILFYFVAKISKSKFDFSNISNTCLYLYLSNHAALTKQLCSLIARRQISNFDFVQGNVSLKFYSENHQKWIYFFVIPGLGLNGGLIPFLIFSILYIKRKQLDQIKIRKHICYLFNEYNENSYYWEQIKIWQKTVIIIIMVYFEAEILLKTTLLGLCLLFYQLLAIHIRPYIISSLNKLDIETGQLCSIAIFLAAARSESVQQNNLVASNFLQVIIVILFIILIYLYVSNIIRVYIQKYKILILELTYFFFKAISPKSRTTKYFSKEYLLEKNKKIKLKANYDKLKQFLVHTARPHQYLQGTSIMTSLHTQRGKILSSENELLKQNVFST